MSQTKFRLAFYYTYQEKVNQRMDWSVTGFQAALACVKRWQMKGVKIHAAYLQTISNKVITGSQRIL